MFGRQVRVPHPPRQTVVAQYFLQRQDIAAVHHEMAGKGVS